MVAGGLHKCIISVWENRFTHRCLRWQIWKGWQRYGPFLLLRRSLGCLYAWDVEKEGNEWRKDFTTIHQMMFLFCKGHTFFSHLFKKMSCTVDNKNYLEFFKLSQTGYTQLLNSQRDEVMTFFCFNLSLTFFVIFEAVLPFDHCFFALYRCANNDQEKLSKQKDFSLRDYKMIPKSFWQNYDVFPLLYPITCHWR